MARYIDANLMIDDMIAELEKANKEPLTEEEVKVINTSAMALKNFLLRQPTADVVEVVQIEKYLKDRLQEWHDLGDRKYEPANMWGYNFIRACFDDLEEYCAGKKVE